MGAWKQQKSNIQAIYRIVLQSDVYSHSYFSFFSQTNPYIHRQSVVNSCLTFFIQVTLSHLIFIKYQDNFFNDSDVAELLN